MLRTAQEVIKEFDLRGISAAEWARENGFTPNAVYQVLRARHVPTRGQSHRIAVALGMKKGHERPNFNLKVTVGEGEKVKG